MNPKKNNKKMMITTPYILTSKHGFAKKSTQGKENFLDS